jgi:hypothetical protein
MKQYHCKTGVAVANISGAMETGNHFKNGAISKSHKNRVNFLNVKLTSW